MQEKLPMGTKYNKYEPLMWVRFCGPDLQLKSLPIYELGSTLIAIQRIIHKAYLFEENRLIKSAQLTLEERKKIALQISETKKESDSYGLIPFVTEIFNIDLLRVLIAQGLIALSGYTLKKILTKKDDAKSPIQIFIISIYNEMLSLADRPNNIGGVKSLEIRPGKGFSRDIPSVIIDEETQNYVRQLRNEILYGPEQKIIGIVTKLDPTRLIAEVKVAPDYFIKVSLHPDDFNFVRYETQSGTQIIFTGTPRYKLGQVTQKFMDFEAKSVSLVKKQE